MPGQTVKLSTKASDSKNFKRPKIFSPEISRFKVVLVLICKCSLYRAVRAGPWGFIVTSLMGDPALARWFSPRPFRYNHAATHGKAIPTRASICSPTGINCYRLIFILLTPLRLNSCSSDSKTNLPKYTTLHSTPPTLLETLASSLGVFWNTLQSASKCYCAVLLS